MRLKSVRSDELEEMKSHFIKSFVSISWRCIGVGPCFFFFFFTTTCSAIRLKHIQRQDHDLFGFRGFDEFRRVEEVMKEVLHAFQPLLIGNRFAGPLLRHLGFSGQFISQPDKACFSFEEDNFKTPDKASWCVKSQI